MDKYLNSFQLSEKQLEQFRKYYQFLVEENQKYNLTSIIEEQEVYIKHFYDSLMVKKAYVFDQTTSMCDIGSGAGFPGIPLKILYPEIHLTMIEPVQKRTRFLSLLVELLDIHRVTIINGRAEDVIITYREKFDVCVARAVANLPILMEISVPFIKVGGKFIAMKGAIYEDELQQSQQAIRELGVELHETICFDLPEERGKRSLLVMTKKRSTPSKYPRNYGLIKKKPL